MMYICENCYEEHEELILCCDTEVTPMFYDYQELDFNQGELFLEPIPSEDPYQRTS